MSTTFARTDNSVLGRWWWTVDRWTVAALVALVFLGAVLTLAASPPVAERLGYDSFHFVRRQFIFIPLAIAVMLATSLLSPRGVRRVAALVLLGCLVLLVATLLLGTEINGARRWLSFGGFSVQPSEFTKPAFAVIAGWLFARSRVEGDIPGVGIAMVLYAVIVGLLMLQPDVGQAVVISVMWFAQFFLAGLSVVWVVGFIVVGVGGMLGAYLLLPHVTSRVDRFLDPASGDTYQITRALEAFGNGGLFGRGPGEGRVKEVLPDAHTDFVFAVAGEELGLLVCLLLVGLFAFVVLRGFARLLHSDDLYVLIAGAGLLVQFGAQAMINMASSLHLIPTKGMTLPFVSCGGSSLLALAMAMGLLLALTRRRPGNWGYGG